MFRNFDYDKSKTLSEQIDILKEDLIQVQYKNGYIIDVGWYPEFSKNGLFKIYVTKNYDICTVKICKNFDELKQIDIYFRFDVAVSSVTTETGKFGRKTA